MGTPFVSSWCRSGLWVAGLEIVLAASILCTVLVATAHGQNRDRRLQYRPVAKKVLLKSPVRLTYGGRAFLEFPNYDIFLFCAPRTLEASTFEAGNPPASSTYPARIVPLANVVMKNEQGMRWDGGHLFLHPAYPSKMMTRFRYTRNIVGEPRGTQWPGETAKLKEYSRKSAPFTGLAQLPLGEFGGHAARDVPRYQGFPIPQLHTDPMPVPDRSDDESTERFTRARNSYESAHGHDNNQPDVEPMKAAIPRTTAQPRALAHGGLDHQWNVKTLKSD